MSSTNKTSLGLNIWEASDKPVRQDFVNDNVIIDEKISELNHNYNDIVNEKISKLNSNLSNKANASDLPVFTGGSGTQTAFTSNYEVTQLDYLAYGNVIVLRVQVRCLIPLSALSAVCNNLPITGRGVEFVLGEGSGGDYPAMRGSYTASGELKIIGGTAGRVFVGQAISISPTKL